MIARGLLFNAVCFPLSLEKENDGALHPLPPPSRSHLPHQRSISQMLEYAPAPGLPPPPPCCPPEAGLCALADSTLAGGTL